ncbi:hypothetical protein Tco_1207165 [Tanacetum coccineum]
MMDVPIHQEDPAVQRTSLIDSVISMVTDKIASIPTPPTTQAQVQMCSTSCWKDSSRESRKLYEWTCRSSQDLEVQVKMEMEIPRSSGVYFTTACSYSTNKSKDLMKAQELQEQRIIKLSLHHQERFLMSMPAQMSQAQDGERLQVDDQRLDLADDLKEAQDHISSTITSHKTKITTSKYKILREESKTTS